MSNPVERPCNFLYKQLRVITHWANYEKIPLKKLNSEVLRKYREILEIYVLYLLLYIVGDIKEIL